MRRLALLSSIVFAFACSKSESPPADTGAAAAPAPAPAPVAPAAAPVSLKDVAGKYTVTGKNEAGDSTLLTYTLNAGDSTWNIVFSNGQKVSQHVTADGDSIIADAGPYPSFLRKGTKVTTHTVYHVQDGKLVGRTVARYDVKTPDSVRIIVAEGVKK